MSGFLYLASPYTHDDPAVREQRYIAACRAAAGLMLSGSVVFSPIAHSHPIETIGIGQTKSGEFWKKQDIPLLRHATKVLVLMLAGWDQSKGVKWEVELATTLNIDVEFIAPSFIDRLMGVPA